MYHIIILADTIINPATHDLIIIPGMKVDEVILFFKRLNSLLRSFYVIRLQDNGEERVWNVNEFLSEYDS